MNEVDLIFAWSEVTNHLWTLLQFWAGISFGLVVLGHIAPEKLSKSRIVFLVILYSVFSVFCASLVAADGALLQAIYEDAGSLAEALPAPSETIRALANYEPEGVGALFIVVALPVVFLGCIGYLVSQYLASK